MSRKFKGATFLQKQQFSSFLFGWPWIAYFAGQFLSISIRTDLIMAKKEAAVCPVCDIVGTGMCRTVSLLALIAGILFLLQDLGVWAFWNISWYTVAFILTGLMFLIAHKK